ncbi:MAG: hypothetical protein WA485_14015 [Candidatus Sulfotelmatobacter sp.]
MTNSLVASLLFCLLLNAAQTPPCGAAEVEGGSPEFTVTSMVITGNVEQVVSAITMAFGNGAYHGKERFFREVGV